jgi:hypothetical protein
LGSEFRQPDTGEFDRALRNAPESDAIADLLKSLNRPSAQPADTARDLGIRQPGVTHAQDLDAFLVIDAMAATAWQRQVAGLG